MHRPRSVNPARDWILFFGGMAGVAHETLVSNVERPTLLILFGGMMGLPVFLRRDESTDDPGSGEAGAKNDDEAGEPRGG